MLAFTETRLNDNSSPPELQGYTFEHVNSPLSAGGVGFYISNSLTYNVRKDLSLNTNKCEDLWIEVSSSVNKYRKTKGMKNIVIGVVYRHPGHKYETFCDNLCDLIDHLDKNKPNPNLT